MGLICKKGLKGVPGNLSIQSATAVTKYTLNKNNSLIYGKKFSKNKFSDFCQTSSTTDCKPFLKDKQSAAAIQIISPIRANTIINEGV